jgi:hypothetical protein
MNTLLRIAAIASVSLLASCADPAQGGAGKPPGAASSGTSRSATPKGGKSTVRLVAVPEAEADLAGGYPEIYVSGEINEKTLRELRALVDKNKLTNAIVQLDSPGGDLVAGMEIGRYLREKAFTTEVGAMGEGWGKSYSGECHSACTLAFLGGKYRHFDENSRFGVHRFYGATERDDAQMTEQETQYIASAVVGFIREMDVDVGLFQRMSEQHSDDVELLDIDEMRRLNVINDGRLAPVWDHSVDAEGVALVGYQESEEGTSMATLACGTPLKLEIRDLVPALEGKAVADAQLTLVMYGASGERTLDARPLLQGTPPTMDGDELVVALQLGRRETTQLLGATALGLRYAVQDLNYGLSIDYADAEDRERIADFLAFCEKSAG